jgi:hypothetical protein
MATRGRSAGSLAAAIAALLLLPAAAAAGKRPPEHLLGIRLGMPDHQVRERLARMGTMQATRPGTDVEQLWTLRDRRFASLLLRFDRDYRVKWMTAYARADGKRLGYHQVADTSLARRSGRYIYIWQVAPSRHRSGYLVVARGTAPERLSSLSLSGLPAAAPETAGADQGRRE